MFSKDDGLAGRMSPFVGCIFLLLPLIFAQHEDCSQVDCELTIPICTPDSILVKHDAEPGRCCPNVVCKCDQAHCATTAIKCENGMERIKVLKATGQLGQCCDQFECRKPVRNCNPDMCPKYNDVTDLHTLSDDSCPEDSFRPPSFVPADGCCLIVSDCRCKASICEPVRCSNDELVVVDRKGHGIPGRCCDKFHCEKKTIKNDCFVNGVYYKDGEQWNSDDSCKTCSCTNGVKWCRQMECEPIPEHCNWAEVPDGECCPTCLGCRDDDGKERLIGDSWVKDDCTNCTCDDSFKPSCQRSLCKVECDNPRKIEGQCCPICDAPLIIETPTICGSVELCPLQCEHGLLRNQWGCFECKCASQIENEVFVPLDENTSADCHEVNLRTCKKQCAHGYLKDAKGCNVCKCAKCPPTENCYKQCLYGFESNAFGCPVCKCRAKTKIDARLSVEQNSDRGMSDICFSRDKHSGQLIERDSGEWWSDNNCRQCFCQQHTVFCSLITCPRRPPECPVSSWHVSSGACCPSCDNKSHSLQDPESNDQILTVCHSPGNGRLFVDGETWDLNGCITCTCRVGHVLCSAQQCPPIACENPIDQATDSCCKVCPDSRSSEIIHVNIGHCIDKSGTSHPILSDWRENDCRSCKCTEDGTVRCYEEHCPSLDSDCKGRALMIKGRCCPICSDSLSSDTFCTYKDNIYGLNEEFHDGQCRNCTCKFGGIVECVEKQCPYCEEPMYSPNTCCPLCQDKNAYLLEGSGQTIFLDNQMVYFSEPMTIYLLLIGIALLILCMCVVGSVVVGKCFYKRKKSLNSAKNKLSTRTSELNKRNVSECESANSLLSSETNNVSLSPSTSLIVHTDRGTIQNKSVEKFPTIPSRFV